MQKENRPQFVSFSLEGNNPEKDLTNEVIIYWYLPRSNP